MFDWLVWWVIRFWRVILDFLLETFITALYNYVIITDGSLVKHEIPQRFKNASVLFQRTIIKPAEYVY
jgi:hypothetical protein